MTEIDTGQHYPVALKELPKSWTYSYVGDFAVGAESGFACGKHSDSDIGVTHVRPYNVSREGKVDLSTKKYVPSGFNPKRLKKNDVLFNNTNSPDLIGKTAVVGIDAEGFAFSNHMTAVTFGQNMEPRFVGHQLHYLWHSGYFFHRCLKHVNQASVSTTELLKKIPLVAAPLNEQRRIVDKIEQLFDLLDKGEESLRAARDKAGLYRQSLLKHAFEGHLTADWRAANPDKLEAPETLLTRIQTERDTRYKEALDDWQDALAKWRADGEEGKKPAKPKRLPEIDFEAGMTLASVIWNVAQGWSPRCKNNPSPSETVWGVIKTTAIQPARFDDTENKELPNELAPREHLELEVGDVLITRAGPRKRVGIACMVKKSRSRLMLCDKAYRLRLEENFISPEFLEAYLNAPHTQEKLEDLKSGINDSGLNLKQEQFLSLNFWLPSPSEQAEIVSRLEAKLSTLDALEGDIDTQLAKSRALRQSILKRAFEGKLVPQDPTDEPAAALLARIKAERDEASKPKRKRKAKA